ncbi:MAG: glycosyltransferase [Acidimicrobiales bacterium]
MVDAPLIPVTVGILTHNSTGTLAPTILSVRRCAEILVCDGNSTDGTRELATALGCTLIDQGDENTDAMGRLTNMTGVRERMVSAARHDWVFILDHDELATDELLDEIGEVVRRPRTHGAYDVPRKYVVQGRVINDAANYPSYQRRLVHRTAIDGYAGIIHDHPVMKEGESAGRLDAAQLVPQPPLRELWPKWIGYMRLEEVGKLGLSRSEWVDQVLRPELRMLKWLLYRTVIIRVRSSGPFLPLRIELSRLAYEVGVIVYTGRRFLGSRRARLDRVWS